MTPANTLMERVSALEQALAEQLNAVHRVTAPAGSKIIFWTKGAVSRDAAERMQQMAKDFGVSALLVSSVDGVLVVQEPQQ